MPRAQSWFSQLRWLEFQNDSGESIPAHAVLRINAFTSPYLSALKPDAFGASFLCAVNGPRAVAIGARGSCTFESPVWVDYDTGSTPAVDESWGPVNADWEINQFSVGFIIIGGATDGRVLCQRTDELSGLGQASSTVAQDADVAVDVYYYNASQAWTDSTLNIAAASCVALQALTSGDRVGFQWHSASNRYLVGCVA